jgi:hypothetical protein
LKIWSGRIKQKKTTPRFDVQSNTMKFVEAIPKSTDNAVRIFTEPQRSNGQINAARDAAAFQGDNFFPASTR